MPAFECPHCGAYANFTHRWSDRYNDDSWGKSPRAGLYTCDHCSLPIAVVYTDAIQPGIERYWPINASGKEFPDVPEALAATANEAHICLNARAPRGAVALARAVVEAIAKNMGITQGTLRDKIERLYAAGHISEAMKEAAHEIRFAGNEAAHGDLIAESLTIEDAEEIVSLMDTMLERVYQEPAQVARIRQQREGRRAKQAEGTGGQPNATSN